MREAEHLAIELYAGPGGTRSVGDYLDRLETSDRARVESKLRIIRSLGWASAIELGILKHFGGDIYEVVAKGTPLRLLGFRARSGAKQVLVLVEAFRKPEWKPRRKRAILERAERLRPEWLGRQESRGP